jgi:2-methylisocitrate lyase-like PEP mutase family enzyme
MRPPNSVSPRSVLASIIRGSDPHRVPFVWDAASAQLAVAAGADVVYMTGFGAAAAHGLADLGLLNQIEVVTHASRIARAVPVPVLMDADDGYGSAANLARTVELIEGTKVGGFHIEDQPFPKTSNSLAGRRLRSAEEMSSRIRIATEIRTDPDLMIVARTDACALLGEESAFERARLYSEAGADAVFVTDLISPGAVERYGSALPGVPKVWYGSDLDQAEMKDCGIVLSLHATPMKDSWQKYLDSVALLVNGPGNLEPMAVLRAAQGVKEAQALTSGSDQHG